ncbi:hypothetical protein [Terrisporobacter glycolicus]|uniref:YjcQ protein n=1 Tax=Terrisporobacter glycolicus ATCC 14880 = DSM 1288 TaxID=1121315 RepID=A0ABZ2EX97_9FIRM|nr:hypothetical protein [Terrisporobacter glycolicus]
MKKVELTIKDVILIDIIDEGFNEIPNMRNNITPNNFNISRELFTKCMKELKEEGKVNLEIIGGKELDIDNLRTTRHGISYIKKIYRLQNL